ADLCEPRRLRKGPHGLAPDSHGRSVTAHQARAAREGEGKVDLLGGDRPDQHLEGRGRQGRPDAGEGLEEGGRAPGLPPPPPPPPPPTAAPPAPEIRMAMRASSTEPLHRTS